MSAPSVLLLSLLAAALLAGCTGAPEVREQSVSEVFTLEPGESIEYKLFVKEDDGFEYEWTANGRVFHDFHGDRGDGSSFFQTHKKGTTDSDSGTFTAPFDGNHGWYYQNPGSTRATISLKATGTFSEVGVV